MAVREALLTLLSVEPNYGFRLHTELCARLPHRSHLNVGQTYATLERAQKSGLVARVGTNTDNLPIFDLTDDGRAVVRSWFDINAAGVQSVDETRDRVYLAITLGSQLGLVFASSHAALEQERERVRRQRMDSAGSGRLENLESQLSTGLIEATLSWLDDLLEADLDSYLLPMNSDRPKRGRPSKRPTTDD